MSIKKLVEGAGHFFKYGRLPKNQANSKGLISATVGTNKKPHGGVLVLPKLPPSSVSAMNIHKTTSNYKWEKVAVKNNEGVRQGLIALYATLLGEIRELEEIKAAIIRAKDAIDNDRSALINRKANDFGSNIARLMDSSEDLSDEPNAIQTLAEELRKEYEANDKSPKLHALHQMLYVYLDKNEGTQKKVNAGEFDKATQDIWKMVSGDDPAAELTRVKAATKYKAVRKEEFDTAITSVETQNNLHNRKLNSYPKRMYEAENTLSAFLDFPSKLFEYATGPGTDIVKDFADEAEAEVKARRTELNAVHELLFGGLHNASPYEN